MPVIIIVAIVALVGVGAYFLRPEDTPSNDILTTTSENIAPAEVAIINTDTVTTATTPDTVNPTTSEPTSATNTTNSGTVTTPAPTNQDVYADGSHTATATYIAPSNSRHNVNVTLTLDNDIVTASTVTFTGDKVSESSKYQTRFANNYQALVVGKKIDSINLARVGGASLTTGAFNDALATIKAEAKL